MARDGPINHGAVQFVTSQFQSAFVESMFDFIIGTGQPIPISHIMQKERRVFWPSALNGLR